MFRSFLDYLFSFQLLTYLSFPFLNYYMYKFYMLVHRFYDFLLEKFEFLNVEAFAFHIVLNQLLVYIHTHTLCWIFIAIVLHYLQIFSPIPEVVLLFCGWFTPFPLWKLLSLIISRLFVFAFIYFALGDWVKKILLQFMPDNVFAYVLF